MVRLRAALTSTALVVLLSGCHQLPSLPTVVDLTGSWTTGDGVELVLHDDQSAELVGVPATIFLTAGDGTISTSQATWTIGYFGEEYGTDGNPLIGVTAMVQGQAKSTSFALSRESGEEILFAYLGDPDSDGRLVLRQDR